MAHIAVENVTDEEQTLQFDGKNVVFAPKGKKGSIRIVEGIPHDHVESRMIAKHESRKRVVNGEEVLEQSQRLIGIKTFKVLPLDEAIQKGAAVEEDPRVIEARNLSEQKAKERAALIGDIKKSLIEDGWQPPQEKNKGGKKKDEDA